MSLAVYVMVVTPGLKLVEGTVFNPVAGELPVVTPVIAHVRVDIEQLSL